jgi:hypothetical protein
VLEIGETDDPVQAVRGAHAVTEIVSLDPEHLLASAGQVPQCSRAHAADADHEGVEGFHAGVPPFPNAKSRSG